MEPQLNQPNFSPESAPSQPKKPENSAPGPKTSEALPAQPLEQLRSQETREKMTGAGVADNTPPAVATSVVAAPAPPVPVVDDTTSDNTNPISAADDDVIEKEWVNKSKKVVAATKGNPYMKEREVSKLQADYLFKRYSKEVKIPEDA